MRKFRRRSESAVLRIEALDRRADHVLDYRRRYLPRASCERLRMIDGAHHVLGRFQYFVAFLAIRRSQSEQNALKSWPSIMIFRRKISAAEKGTAIRCEKSGQRPSTLAADRLYRSLIAAIDVRTLVAIDLYRNVLLVDDFRDLGILVRLPIHHVAPVAPHCAHVEQH